jgi:ribosomal protein S18 acetylase RimI-like enzyme
MADIRTINSLDANQLFALLKEAHAASQVPIGPQWTAAQLASECEPTAEKMGFVLLSGRASIDAFVLFRDTGAAWEISFLATAVDARGQGRMTLLLQYLMRQRPNDKPLWLEVHEANNTARRMYARLGFREVGRRPNYYTGGGAAVLYNYG